MGDWLGVLPRENVGLLTMSSNPVGLPAAAREAGWVTAPEVKAPDFLPTLCPTGARPPVYPTVGEWPVGVPACALKAVTPAAPAATPAALLPVPGAPPMVGV